MSDRDQGSVHHIIKFLLLEQFSGPLRLVNTSACVYVLI